MTGPDHHMRLPLVGDVPLDRVYGALALVFGLVSALAMPPFAIWDERTHWLRAVELSQGVLHPRETHEGWAISRVPVMVQYVIDHDVNTHPDRPVDWTWYREQLAIPLKPDETMPALQWATTPCCYVVYLPQAIGIAIARACGGGPIAMLLAGRVTALLAGIPLVMWAIRSAPGFRLLFLGIALLPVTVGLTGSVSADAVFLPVSLLLGARLLRILVEGEPSRREIVLVCGLALVLGLARFPYVLLPLVLVGAISHWRQSARWGFVAGMATACIVTGLWVTAARGLVPAIHRGAGVECHPSAQLRHTLRHPWDVATTIAVKLREQGAHLAGTATHFSCAVSEYEPVLMSMLLPAWLILLSAVDRPRRRATWPRLIRNDGTEHEVDGGIHEFTAAERWGAALATGLIVGLISFSSYLWWNAPGAHTLAGIQPRYFLPLAGLMGLFVGAVPLRWTGDTRHLAKTTIALAIAAFGHSYVCLLEHYWRVTPRLWLEPEVAVAASFAAVWGLDWVARRRGIDRGESPVASDETLDEAAPRRLKAAA